MKIKLSKIADLLEGKLLNLNFNNKYITGISSIEQIEDNSEDKIICIMKKKYINYIKENNIKVGCIVIPEEEEDIPNNIAVIKVADVRVAFVKLLHLFYKEEKSKLYYKRYHIDESVKLGKGVKLPKNIHISPYVVIGDRVKLGEGCIIYPFVYIGDDVQIGKECIIYASVVIREGTIIGNKVIIHSGAVISSDGFGYVKTDGLPLKVPQMGNVIIEDEVEIGANTTIDRATLGSTRIGKGTKIDNLVQIAHNVNIGKYCLIAAQVGISGSVNIGDRVIIGGQVGIADHVNIAEGTVIAAKSGVAKDTKPYEKIWGSPARELQKEKRIVLAQAHIPEMVKKIKELEKKLFVKQ